MWVVPALRQLHEITRSFIKQTYQKQDKVRICAEILTPSLRLYGSASLEFRKERGGKKEEKTLSTAL